MAQSRTRKRDKKPRKHSGATGSRNLQVRRAPSPKTRLSKLFKLMGSVTKAAEQAILSTPNPDYPLVRFDVEILNRGANSVKSVRTLLEQGHWEHAVGVARQLFELLVNMEYLATLEDREKATLQFARYGLLQYLLAEQRKVTYDRDSGRPFDSQKAALVDHHLANDFSDFQDKPKADGSPNWAKSWCRRDARALAEQSADPMRIHQYDILYRVWSEQAHAAPGALIRNIFRDNNQGWVEQAVEENERWSVDTIAFTIMFFLRLWLALPSVRVSADRVADWLSEINTHYGGSSLGTLPEDVVKPPQE